MDMLYNPEFDSLKAEMTRKGLWHKASRVFYFCCM